MLRPLSAFQAANCEAAREPQCDCRCGGRFHGAKRVQIEDGATDKQIHAAFERLPDGDPHRLPTKDESKGAAKMRKQHRKNHIYPWRGSFGTGWGDNYRVEPCVVCVAEGRPTREQYEAEHPVEAEA